VQWADLKKHLAKEGVGAMTLVELARGREECPSREHAEQAIP
jgi:hypothetical protein